MRDLDRSTQPRNWENSEACGSFALASRVSEAVLNPGETLKFEQFITGYGEIKQCKIQCYISSDIFEHTASKITHGINKDPKSGMITWGQQSHNVGGEGFHIIFNGLQAPQWNESTVFFDATPGMLATEIILTKAPLDYALKTKKNIKPGAHYLDFYMTYFDGYEWRITKERVDFRINNSFEKHSSLISFLAFAALIVTILHDGIGPALELIHELGKMMLLRHQ
ncbi:hypothetical protein [Pseudomonas inefficax]|uniref:hypothetical protein n=1 Tax=Pseudomonas inefficax TaxID=2078786 RepID=UPI0040469F73